METSSGNRLGNIGRQIGLRERRERGVRGVKEMEKQNRKIEEKVTKQIVIDAEMHRLLKVKASKAKMSLKELAEGQLGELIDVKNEIYD